MSNKQLDKMIAYLESLKTEEPKEVKRWRAEKLGEYWFINLVGSISVQRETLTTTDNLCYNTGNYFKTEEEAKSSTLYHVMNSEYFYWFPDMPKLKEIPKNCERYSLWDRWIAEDEEEPSEWQSIIRRWPK